MTAKPELGIQWVGPAESGPLSEMAREILFEFYDFVDFDILAKYYAKNQTRAAIMKQMEDGLRYGYVLSDGERIGYVSCGFKDGRFVLNKLYLYESKRGVGAGAYAIEAVVGIAAEEGADSVWLEVNSMNSGAMRFYKREGFEEAGERGHHGTRVTDMVLKINPEASPSNPL